jgi:hypothetical protein
VAALPEGLLARSGLKLLLHRVSALKALLQAIRRPRPEQ